jgi:hypothetical protein
MEHCIISAIKIATDTNGVDLIVVGRRHHDIISSLHHANIQHKNRSCHGFLTNKGRFVTRKEGYDLQVMNDIPSASLDGYRHGLRELFSEDLY